MDIKGGLPASTLTSMRDAMTHRGPDGFGQTLLGHDGHRTEYPEAARGGLAHRRLSIVDLTEAGAQPMANEDGSVWITYNGECYNFQDFRHELEQRGHVFRSHCDTETIIHLYEEFGIEETLRRMNGMWGFGLYDGPGRKLILARDRVGKKPLYYAEVQGGLLFASEMKALYASGLIDLQQLDDEAVADSLRVGTPLGPRTMFRQIRMVPPGHYAVWEKGRLSIHRYYVHPMERLEPEDRTRDDFADELEALLEDAIRIRLIADVPVGLFLSGGVDSSLVAAVTKRRLRRDVNAYCISFDDQAYDESEHARRVAAHLELPFHVMPSSALGPDTYEQIAVHIDQPIGDASLVPTYLVSRSARAAGVKAILTGDGGDELFAGYDTYRSGLKFWGSREERALVRTRTLTERLWEKRIAARGLARGYIALQNQFSMRHRLRIYRSAGRAWRDGRAADRRREAAFDRVRHRPVLDRMQYSDMNSLMVDVVLRKVDLMSMANSIECRSPLLDYRMLEFAARLPTTLKMIPNQRGKVLLRHLLARYVPPALFERPKMGFGMPWETVCTGAYAASLKQRWRQLEVPHLRRNAGDWLFDETGVGGMYRKWAAFTQLVFFDKIYH
jgi:asparagine synthase (glutamine-hydrolysing)